MAQQILNSDFESSVVPNGQQKYGSDADSSKSWGFHGSCGVYMNGSKHNGGGSTLPVPNSGTRAAFLFAANASLRALGTVDAPNVPTISQTFPVTTPAAYTLSFASAQQNSGASACTLRVGLRGSAGKIFQDYQITPTTSFATTTIPLGTLPAQNYTITFTAVAPIRFGIQGGTSYASLVSGMVFLDDVSVA